MEVEQRVVAVVADERVVGPAPETRGVQPDADVLVDLPRDAGPLQPLGVGRPVVAGSALVITGPPAAPSLPTQPVHM